MFEKDSTIIALATPMGMAPLAILRVSGPKTFEITGQLFQSSRDFQQSEGYEIFFGYIRDPQTGMDVDQVLLSVFRAPRSFTGEDMVEITCHGGIVLFQKILDLYLAMGASLAPRGEFSKRAFFNGKLDLTQAEAIHDLIFSRSFKTAQTVLRSLKKNFFHTIQDIKAKILTMVSKIEVSIDYSEEYSESLDQEDRNTISEILKELSTLQHQAHRLQEYNKGHIVGIVGEPNAGKSSLLNMLVGEQKAIVSNIAGTTRDPIEVSMTLEGIPVTLVDTAGLREEPHNDIEQQGIQKSRDIMNTADLNLVVVDIHEFSDTELKSQLAWMTNENIPFILVWNKQDLAPSFSSPPGFQQYSQIFLSCHTNQGLNELLQMLQGSLHLTDMGDGQFFLNQRQSSLLWGMENLLKEVFASLEEEKEIDSEVISLLFQNTLALIGELDGSDVQESILDTIFSHFCVGK